MSMSATGSIPDTALGLTPSELQLFRQQQQIAEQGHRAQQAAAATATRGRGQSRSSHPSSRATSAASSQGGQGRIFLDVGSLHRLNAHLEQLMRRIMDRIDDLQEATTHSVISSHASAVNAMQNTDAEMARMRRIIAEIDHLEGEFDKVRRIRDVVKQLRARADDIAARLEQSSRSNGHGHGQAGRDSRRR